MIEVPGARQFCKFENEKSINSSLCYINQSKTCCDIKYECQLVTDHHF